jgi:hypothetical protein
LESLQVGGTRCTSREALARFFQRLTDRDVPAAPPTRTVAQRQRAAERAIRDLEKAGA